MSYSELVAQGTLLQGEILLSRDAAHRRALWRDYTRLLKWLKTCEQYDAIECLNRQWNNRRVIKNQYA